MSEIVPIFFTHHSIAESILTVEKEEQIKNPVSALAIAKIHGQKEILVVDSDISSYWKLYKNTKELGLHLVFGLKITICANSSDKEPTSHNTESSVIIIFNNSQAYYDFVPIYTKASTINFLKRRRLDWEELRKFWTDNFSLYIPFYSSFIARNLLRLDHKALPSFGSIKPTFFINNQGLPFDGIIDAGVRQFCDKEGYDTQLGHSVYYYKDENVMKHLTIQCINKRTTWDKPNIEHYGSANFSYESYLRSAGK